MDKAPVYFIGGTFGGGTSPIVVAVVTATLTAFGTLVVGWLIEDYKRHRDKRALAGALRSEITVTLQLLAELNFEAKMTQIREMLIAGIQSGLGRHAVQR